MRPLLVLLALACGLDQAGTIRLNIAPYSTAAPVPGPGSLFQLSDLTYRGAFRIRNDPNVNNYSHSAGNGNERILTFWPSHTDALGTRESLLIGNSFQQIAEITIPTAVDTTFNSLPYSDWIQGGTAAGNSGDILRGKLGNVDGDPASNVLLGGLLILPNGNFVVTGYRYYDNGVGGVYQTKGHFLVNRQTHTTFASLVSGDTTGPFQVGTGWQAVQPAETKRIAGIVAGYMTAIPSAYQAALGGPYLTGLGAGPAIVDRTSSGPSVSVFDPADLGVTIPAPVVHGLPALGYPGDSSSPGSSLDHQAIGPWGNTTYPLDGSISNRWYNGMQIARSVLIPAGYRSVLFPGHAGYAYNAASTGIGFCYGGGTTNASLHLTFDPSCSIGGHECCKDFLNVEGGGPGAGMAQLSVRASPEFGHIYAYDIDDLADVIAGTKMPYQISPYGSWAITLPFTSSTSTYCGFTYDGSNDNGVKRIAAAAHDPATKRVWFALTLAEYFNGGDCTNNKNVILEYSYP